MAPSQNSHAQLLDEGWGRHAGPHLADMLWMLGDPLQPGWPDPLDAGQRDVPEFEAH